MKRQLLVAFAIVASLLAVTGMPAAAANASGSLEVASKHTNATDFNSAQELTNVTVEGSGQSANATLGANQNYNPYTDEGNGVKDNNAEIAGDTLNDDSANVEVRINPDTSGDISSITPTISQVDGSDYGASVDVYIAQETPDGTYGEGTLVKSEWDPDWSTGDQTIALDTSYSVSAGTNYAIEFVTQSTDNDGTKDMLYVSVDTDASEVWYSYLSTSIDSSYADVTVPIESSPESGTYVGGTHDADSVEQGFTNLTLQNAEADVTWLTDTDDDGTFETTVNSTTYTTSGNKTLALDTSHDDWRVEVQFNNETGSPTTAKLHDEGVLFDASAPTVDNGAASPQGNEKLNESSVTLEVPVNDSDIGTAQGDTVDVEFQHKGPNDNSFTTLTTTTLNSNGTASTTQTFSIGGDHEWRAVATDSYGTSTTSDTYQFDVPANVTIFNETSPGQQITSVNVTGTFFGDDEIVVNETDTGAINLTNKPVDEPLVVVLEADDYHTRPTLIETVYEQDRVYMLSTNEATVEVRFTLEDRTGVFPTSESRIAIQRPITRDRDGDGANETEWETVAGDAFGVAGATFDLEQSQRYRVILRNEDGDQRVLGSYTADVSETVALEVGEVESVPEGFETEYRYNATYLNDSATSTNYVQFEFNDSEQQTTEVIVNITQRGNFSNVLLANQTFDGGDGNVSSLAVSQAVPSDEEEFNWIVTAWIDRGGESFKVQLVVGPRDPVLLAMPNWLKAIISIGSIWIIAGLFSQLNGDVGALVTAGMGAMWWYVDFLPEETGVGVVVLSLITAGIIFIHQRRGGGL